jgi:hypothetical protein
VGQMREIGKAYTGDGIKKLFFYLPILLRHKLDR